MKEALERNLPRDIYASHGKYLVCKICKTRIYLVKHKGGVRVTRVNNFHQHDQATIDKCLSFRDPIQLKNIKQVLSLNGQSTEVRTIEMDGIDRSSPQLAQESK